MMLDVSLTLGTVVPMLVGYFLFSEEIAPKQWIGFSLLVLAVLIMTFYNKSIGAKQTVGSVLLLIACGLANGVTASSQKGFVKLVPDIPVSVFNLYTYVFAALTLFLFFAFFSRGEKAELDKANIKRVLLYVSVMAAALAVNSFFLTLASAHLESAKLFPLNQGAAMILSSLISTFFFKEKMKLSAIVGIALSFVALLIINL